MSAQVLTCWIVPLSPRCRKFRRGRANVEVPHVHSIPSRDRLCHSGFLDPDGARLQSSRRDGGNRPANAWHRLASSYFAQLLRITPAYACGKWADLFGSSVPWSSLAGDSKCAKGKAKAPRPFVNIRGSRSGRCRVGGQP
jgi:hypothetical protein